MATGKKTGGRQAGTPNKATAGVKSLVSGFLTDNFDRFKTEAANLEGKDFCTFYLKLIDFELPKLSRQQTALDFSQLTEDEANEVLSQIVEKLKKEIA